MKRRKIEWLLGAPEVTSDTARGAGFLRWRIVVIARIWRALTVMGATTQNLNFLWRPSEAKPDSAQEADPRSFETY